MTQCDAFKLHLPEREDAATDTLYVQHFKDDSVSRPTLICVPGGPGADHAIYRDQVEHFLPLVDVVLFDPRGCGQSTISSSSCYAMDVTIDDVEVIGQQLGIDKLIVLGTSYGSMVAQGYAIKYGHNVLQALILVAGSASYEFIDTAASYLRQVGTAEQIDQFNQLLSGNITTDDALRRYFEVMAPLYSLSVRKQQPFHAAKKDVRYNAEAAAGFGPNGFLRTFDWRKDLPNLQCPTLIIGGQEDWINRPSQLREMHELIPHSQLTLIPNAGHFVWADQKNTYFERIYKFIAGYIV